MLGHWSSDLTPRPTPSAPLGLGPSGSGLITQPVFLLQTVGLLSSGCGCTGPVPLQTPDPGTAQGQTAQSHTAGQFGANTQTRFVEPKISFPSIQLPRSLYHTGNFVQVLSSKRPCFAFSLGPRSLEAEVGNPLP